MWWEYRRSVPRQAEGGIKAQSKRGSFGKSWWAKRWIEVLEGFDIGARLARGRSYARRGQVLSIDISVGGVSAKVQGSRSTPYKVEIDVARLTTTQWESVIEELAAQAFYTAKLLAGEMPETIEEVFDSAKVSLFPSNRRDLVTDCSCPDWSNPCKHIAAVYYLLGEEFDRDPFLLFRLRGLPKEVLLAKLAELGSFVEDDIDEEAEEGEALPKNPEEFWGGTGVPQHLFGDVRIPATSAALPRRLGAVPLWQGANDFLASMERLYSAASRDGFEWFVGEEEEQG